MTAFSEALHKAMSKAEAGGGGNIPPVSRAVASASSAPIFAELFRVARDGSQARLKAAQSLYDQTKVSSTLGSLQAAQHVSEEIERQILIVRELFSLAIDVDDEVTRHAGRVDSWLAMVGNRAARLVRRVLQ